MTDPPPSAHVHIYLFGKFEIKHDNRVLRLPSRKDEALIAYLLLHPGQHHRDKLAALLWSEGSNPQSRASLRNALAVLRKTLGETLLIADRDYIQVNPEFPVYVDALEFKKQAQQFQFAAIPDMTGLHIELYRGDLLADFSDDWIIPIQESCRQLYRHTLLLLAQRQRSQGHYDAAIALAQQMLELEPADEQAHQLLMSCYFALGDRPSALHQFEILQQILRDDLAAEPQRETLLLYQRIRDAALTPCRTIRFQAPDFHAEIWIPVSKK